MSSTAYLSNSGTPASSSLSCTDPSIRPAYSFSLALCVILARVLMASTLCWRTELRHSGRSSLSVYPAAYVQTDTHTHKPTTVTLAAHACRGLRITCITKSPRPPTLYLNIMAVYKHQYPHTCALNYIKFKSQNLGESIHGCSDKPTVYTYA